MWPSNHIGTQVLVQRGIRWPDVKCAGGRYQPLLGGREQMPLHVSQQPLEPRLRLFVSLVVHGNQQRQPVPAVAHIGGHHRN